MTGKEKRKRHGKRTDGYTFDPEEVVIIGLDTDDGPEHGLFNDSVKKVQLADLEPMVLNMMINGCIQPIVVTPRSDKIMVVAGRKRTRALREANKRLAKQGLAQHRLRAEIRRGADGDLFGVMISENELRIDDDPFQRATNAQRYMNMGYSESDAAIHFGTTTATIKNWLKQLELEPEVKETVRAGKIKPTAAAQLAGLDRQGQLDAAKDLTDGADKGEKPTVQRARAAAQKQEVKKQAASKPTTPKESTTEPTSTPPPKSPPPDAGIVAPGKRLARKVIDMAETSNTLPDSFVDGVRWAIGDLSSDVVVGMTAMLEEIAKPKEPPKKLTPAKRRSAK